VPPNLYTHFLTEWGFLLIRLYLYQTQRKSLNCFEQLNTHSRREISLRFIKATTKSGREIHIPFLFIHVMQKYQSIASLVFFFFTFLSMQSFFSKCSHSTLIRRSPNNTLPSLRAKTVPSMRMRRSLFFLWRLARLSRKFFLF